MMTIGEFAVSTGLSVKALRFYDDRGLLTPAEVDPHSGYRRYSAGQLRTASTIRVLRTAGLSVDAVRTALNEPGRLDALLTEHQEAQARQRDLEDRALKLSWAQANQKDHDDGAAASGEPAVQFRTAEATPWVAVVQRLQLEEDLAALEEAGEQGGDALSALQSALEQAGVPLTGGYWTGLRRVGGSAVTIDLLLSFAVEEQVPSSSFSVPGWTVETGVLPRREEVFVSTEMAIESLERLEDAPGGPLPDEGTIRLAEALEERGLEGVEQRLRQDAVDDAGDGSRWRVEVSATLRELGEDSATMES